MKTADERLAAALKFVKEKKQLAEEDYRMASTWTVGSASASLQLLEAIEQILLG